MKKLRFTMLLAIGIAMTGPGIASAKLMPNVVNEATRFSGSCCVYTGAPALLVTLSMVEAGGGPSDFSTVTLLKVLAGSHFDPEVAKLTKEYGKDQVGQFLKTFDFVVADSLKIVGEKKIALPSKPSPDPKNGAALAGASRRLPSNPHASDGRHRQQVRPCGGRPISRDPHHRDEGFGCGISPQRDGADAEHVTSQQSRVAQPLRTNQIPSCIDSSRLSPPSALPYCPRHRCRGRPRLRADWHGIL
jgi:hypothetical protein